MIRSQVVIILFENKKKLDTAVPEFISIFIYLFHLIHDKLHDERTCVPRKVRRSPKLPGVRRSPEPFARSADEGEISVCKVLVLIKLVPVKNDYFLHSKFELYRYQQFNGFLYWLSFTEKIWRIY